MIGLTGPAECDSVDAAAADNLCDWRAARAPSRDGAWGNNICRRLYHLHHELGVLVGPALHHRWDCIGYHCEYTANV